MFDTKIYHPNISDMGEICLDMLYPNCWSPAFAISVVLQSIRNLLSAPSVFEALCPDIAFQYENDYAQFEQNAREVL